MNEIGTDIVNRCLLSNVREAVNALTELAEYESGNSALLNLVKKTVNEEFFNAARKIAEQMNDLVRKYNNRECVIAGVVPEVKATKDEKGCINIGRTVWMDTKRIGIRKVGETNSYALTIDDDDVPGTGLSYELAMRLIKAIEAFRTSRDDKTEAHE